MARVVGFLALWRRTCRLRSAADSRHSEASDGAGAELGVGTAAFARVLSCAIPGPPMWPTLFIVQDEPRE
jgi:hypothetical protein